jgi:hypothetical protein
MKTNINAEIIPGKLSGKITRSNTSHGLQPRSPSASIRLRSIRSRAAKIGSVANGIQT